MLGAATFTTYGPNSAAQGLEEAEAFNQKSAINNPAAYGSVPAAPSIMPTVSQATGGAMSAGQAAANQLPGYSGDLSTIGSNISSLLSGNVPEDVVAQLQTQAAERGVATGTSGSANNNAAYLRALGLTSLGLQNQGASEFNQTVMSLPGYGISQNPAFQVTPEQQYQAQLQANVYAAAPQPAAAAAAALAATGRGFGLGSGSIGGGLGSPTAVPAATPSAATAGPVGGVPQLQQTDPTTEILNKYDPNNPENQVYSIPGWIGSGTISEPGEEDTVDAFGPNTNSYGSDDYTGGD